MENYIARRWDLAGDLIKVTARGDRSTATYRSLMRTFVSSGHPATVEGFGAHVEEVRRTSTAATVNLTIAAGRKAFIQAGERQGMSTRDLAVLKGALSELRNVRIAPREVKTVTPDERALLFKALPLRVRLIAETLYTTGARVSEIVSLRRDQVRANGHVELRIRGKGDKERIGKIPAGLYRRIVVTFSEDGPFLFTTGHGNAYRPVYVSREIARAAERAIGRSVTAHVLRHSRATDLLAATHRIKAVSRLLGHADEAVTLRFYVKDSFTDEELFAGV